MLVGKYKNMFLAPHIPTACTVLNVNAMAEANTIAWVRGSRPKQNIYSLYRHLTTLNSTIQHSFSLDILRFRHIVSPRKLQIKDDIKRREYLNRKNPPIFSPQSQYIQSHQGSRDYKRKLSAKLHSSLFYPKSVQKPLQK